MKELLILSGKGGTGKTTVASAFIQLANAKAYADADVDAPNLHLTMKQTNAPKKEDYYGLDKGTIQLNLCIQCDACRQHCRFQAIEMNPHYNVDPYACEGCGVCEVVCPTGAVTLEPAIAGELMLYENNHKVFSTAQLKMGNGNSGLLVTKVKKQLKSAANHIDFAIIDGSPGIGCPVIASINGVHFVLIVAEPSISGMSDLIRIVKTVRQFQVRCAVCVNKHDLNMTNTQKIISYCEDNNIPFVGNIPYDVNVVKMVNNGQQIVEEDSLAGNALKEVFQKTIELL